jgi:hypothetical protein
VGPSNPWVCCLGSPIKLTELPPATVLLVHLVSAIFIIHKAAKIIRHRKLLNQTDESLPHRTPEDQLTKILRLTIRIGNIGRKRALKKENKMVKIRLKGKYHKETFHLRMAICLLLMAHIGEMKGTIIMLTQHSNMARCVWLKIP